MRGNPTASSGQQGRRATVLAPQMRRSDRADLVASGPCRPKRLASLIPVSSCSSAARRRPDRRRGARDAGHQSQGLYNAILAAGLSWGILAAGPIGFAFRALSSAPSWLPASSARRRCRGASSSSRFSREPSRWPRCSSPAASRRGAPSRIAGPRRPTSARRRRTRGMRRSRHRDSPRAGAGRRTSAGTIRRAPRTARRRLPGR